MKSIQFKGILILLLSILFVNANALTYFSRANAAWNVNSTWSTEGYTSATNTGTYPVAGDVVNMGGGFTVTISGNEACTTLNFTHIVTSSTLTITGSNSLNVSGAITMFRPGSAFNNTLNVNAGTLIAGSLTMNATTLGGGSSRRTTINISTGTAIIGNVVTLGVASRFEFSGAGTLDFTGSTSWTGAPTITTSAGCTIKYTSAGTQTVRPVTYQNLTLGGSGTKTTTAVTVNGIMSYEGTSVPSVAPTFGGNSTIQYKGTALTRTTSNNEFPNNFSGTGGLIIDQGAGNSVVLNANKTALTSINIKSGSLDLSTFTANRASAGGSLTIGANAGLIIGGTNTLPSNYTTHSINCSSTVNYDGTNQTVTNPNSSQTYGNLVLSGSGTKTLQATMATICSGFTVSGTASVTAVRSLAIGGRVTIESGSTFNASTFTHTVGGDWTNNGGTFTPSIGTISFTGVDAQINGTAATQTFNNITINKTAGQTLSVGGSTTAIVVSGTTLLSNGNFAVPTTLTLNGNLTNNSGGFIPGSGTVSMNGNGFTIGGTAETTFNNLTINNAGRTNLGNNVFVNNTLLLTAGLLSIGNYNITMGPSANSSFGTPGNTKMVVSSGSGQFRKYFDAPSSYVFPIGEETGVSEYSPITITINSATFAPGALVAAKVTDDKHPNDGSTTNFISRFWTINQTGISNMSASITATFLPADITGNYTNIITSRYVSPVWVEHNVATSNTLSASALVAFGDFTGRNNLPVMNVSPTALSGFTYLEGLGPSAEQLFTVSGSALTTNITVLPSDKYEISTTSGVAFAPSSLITVNVVNREVPTTTIYVRQKAGLSAGIVSSENVVCSTTGVTSINVVCSGSVTNAPLITPTVTTLSGFIYKLGAGPSATKSFTVNGNYLTNDIVVTAPTNYEIQSGASGYVSSLTLTRSGQTLSTVVNVRLKAGLLASYYNEDITLTTTNGLTKTVRCEGQVNTATVGVSKFTLAGFIYTVSNGPSGVQSFIASGSNLTSNVVISPPATGSNFEISTDSLSGYVTTTINLAPVSGSVSTKIYVRMRSSLSVGVIGVQKITVSSTGAISQTVACSGQVVNSPTTISSVGTLNGFFYISGAGPSVKQMVTVSATGLSTPVTVTAPAHYEISLSGAENTFVTNGATLSIPNNGGKVNAVPVYIRLKSGWSVGSYNAENVTLSATGATTINVVCNGKVVVAPTITAGPEGLDPTCQNTNVTLSASGTGIANYTWTGPGGFYSTEQNPALGIVTAADNGTYTVTGNSLSGVNLITNGDFELGNTGFGSSYIYQQTAPPEKGNYWISANPQDVYGSFCNCADHSTSGTQMMTVDGGTTNGMVVWSQTVAVAPMTDFQFSYWLLNVYNYNNDVNRAKLQLYINNVPIGTVNIAPPYGDPWAQFRYNANSGNNTSLQLTLINTSLEPNGNDFALDDIDFQQVVQVSSSVTLNVVPTVSPSLTVTASENPVFSNTIVTYTATPVNGGTAPTYQWKVNGVNYGSPTTSTTFQYTPVQGDNISCVLTSNYECISPQTATAGVTMTVNPRTNYWRGNISTDWGTAANWTGGFVPAAGDDVVFAKKSNNNGVAAERDLQLDINRTIGYLINDSASLKVIIPANLTLIVNNSIQSGTNPDKILVKASSTLANGSIIYRNPQNLPAYGTVEMYSPASWNKANAVNNRYNWQFFGIPVTSVSALPTFYKAYVRELFESDADTATHWRMLTNESVLIPFKGYELCQQAPAFYTFRGQLINSNYNSGQFVKTAGALYPGQHLFANPYTSAIDIRQIEFGTNVEATAYLYNTGTFTSWKNNPAKSVLLESPVPGQYNSAPKQQAGNYPGIPRQIPSMGTFMVRILPANASTSQSYINLVYNSVSMGNTDKQRAKSHSLTDEQTTTGIVVEGEYGLDKVWLMSNENYTRNFDNGYDGLKMLGNAMSPQLFAVEKDGKYQINSVDDINNTTLAFQAGQDTEYKMTFTHDANTQLKYKKILLHDLVENRIVDITASGTEYNFTANSTVDPVIRFKVLAQNDSQESGKPSDVKVYYYDNQLYVQNFSTNEGRVYVYDISGRTIGIKTIAANQNIQIRTPEKNIYIVKVAVGNYTETTKVLLH